MRSFIMLFRASFWDRLASSSDVIGYESRINLSELKAAVAVDLEKLLNTRQAQHPHIFSGFPLSEQSVANFGVADFASRSLSSGIDRDEICRSISSSIQRFDTRLSEVVVRIRPSKIEHHKLAFDIKAVLKVADVVDSVSFDVLFDSASMQYKFNGSKVN